MDRPAPQDDESGQVALKPIHVYGAGPSGLAAALAANQAGRRVIVHERCSDVGHRFHDDFQGLENWTTDGDVLDELVGLGIEPTFDHTPIREAVVFDPRRVHTYRSPRPLFYLVRRGARAGTLDSSLKAQALARGIELRFGEARPQLPEGGVVAEGPHGSDAVALGYVFATQAADGAFAAMSDRLAPKGYAMLSGSLAARSLVSGRLDGYDRLWEERLGGLLRTGIVNRFLYGRLGARGYRGLAWLLDRTADPRSLLGRLYRPSLLARLLYPIARQAIRSGRRTRLRRREPTGTG